MQTHKCHQPAHYSTLTPHRSHQAAERVAEGQRCGNAAGDDDMMRQRDVEVEPLGARCNGSSKMSVISVLALIFDYTITFFPSCYSYAAQCIA
jgi:hypothetical protein